MTGCSVIVTGETPSGTPIYMTKSELSRGEASAWVERMNAERVCVSMYDPEAGELWSSLPGETLFHCSLDV